MNRWDRHLGVLKSLDEYYEVELNSILSDFVDDREAGKDIETVRNRTIEKIRKFVIYEVVQTSMLEEGSIKREFEAKYGR